MGSSEIPDRPDCRAAVSQGTPALPTSSSLPPPESNQTAQSAHAAADSARNPSYPQRVHFGERKGLQDKLASWDEKIAAMGKKLGSLGTHPHRSSYERLYHQMQ